MLVRVAAEQAVHGARHVSGGDVDRDRLVRRFRLQRLGQERGRGGSRGQNVQRMVDRESQRALDDPVEAGRDRNVDAAA